MEQVPKNDTDQSWEGLREALVNHQNQLSSLPSEEIESVLQTARDIEQTGQPYPRSFSEFYSLINENVVKDYSDF